MVRRRLFNHAGSSEPWEVAAVRLAALVIAPTPPTRETVLDALEPIEIRHTSLDYSEAARVGSLLGLPEAARRAVIRAATVPRSVPTFYDAVALIDAVRARRRASRETALVRASNKAREASLNEQDARRLAGARSYEVGAIEDARAHEALAKSGVIPVWSAKSKHNTAQQATRERKALEKRLGIR